MVRPELTGSGGDLPPALRSAELAAGNGTAAPDLSDAPDSAAEPVAGAATTGPPPSSPPAGGAAPVTDVLAGASAGIPRWLLLVGGLAAATVAIAGIRALSWLIAPLLLAFVVVLALTPVQSWLRRAGVPRWLAATILLVLVWGVLLGFVVLLIVSVGQLADRLPAYADQAESLIDGVVTDLNDAGIVSGQVSDLVDQIDYGQVVSIATGLFAALTDAGSTLLLLLLALVFLVIESGGFGTRLRLVADERPHLRIALGLFVRGTRSYLWVSTLFGAIVAVGDGLALWMLGVPLPVLWGLLAFVTNYIPNIGFVLGLLPPALLGLLEGGWGQLGAIVAVYAGLNFVVQTLIQPRFVGDSVGLSTTVTFVAVLFWGWVLGALGAFLAIPLTLLVKALLVDVDPRGHWLDAFLREEPRPPRTSRARERLHARQAARVAVQRLHRPRRAPAPPAVDEPAPRAVDEPGPRAVDEPGPLGAPGPEVR
ncbi:AI-2E family transporter [Candidatus Blastococcus massiliensis]|uniref:AI-2E family transporter n=1 Tax=Candidatus Blastococcus massiliensis TaxID=1470358 RepID=UPI0004AD721E|nr:AI-2E family transporter [Candidatus Blastococcus massiliensis]